MICVMNDGILRMSYILLKTAFIILYGQYYLCMFLSVQKQVGCESRWAMGCRAVGEEVGMHLKADSGHALVLAGVL